MSTKLKTDYYWVKKDDQIIVYSDYGRFYRESFGSQMETITPHNAIEFLVANESAKIDLSRVGSSKLDFVKEILLKKSVKNSQII